MALSREHCATAALPTPASTYILLNVHLAFCYASCCRNFHPFNFVIFFSCLRASLCVCASNIIKKLSLAVEYMKTEFSLRCWSWSTREKKCSIKATVMLRAKFLFFFLRRYCCCCCFHLLPFCFVIIVAFVVYIIEF